MNQSTPPDASEPDRKSSGSGSGMLLSSFAMALETACQQLLKLDPVAEQAFAQLEGKVLELAFSDLGFSLYFVPGQSMRVYSYYDGSVDTRIIGTSIALMAMGLRDKSSDSLFKGEVQIQGDTHLGARFQDLLKSIDVDWEEHLSKFTGDVVAHQVGNLVRGLLQWGRDTLDTLRLDISEYTQEELRVVPTGPEVEAFVSDVDNLRDDADRLLQRAQKILAGSSGETSATTTTTTTATTATTDATAITTNATTTAAKKTKKKTTRKTTQNNNNKPSGADT